MGPKVAQKVVFAAPVEEVKDHIMKGNLAFLSGIPGIGKKTAQKIILELKGVLTEEGESMLPSDRDAVEALVGLGYSRRQAEEACSGLEGSMEEQVRAALKTLARMR